MELLQILSARIPQFRELPEEIQKGIAIFVGEQIYKLKKLSEIAVALSAEKVLERLLENILEQARTLTNADGGTLYLLDEKLSLLCFAIVQNETLMIREGGTSSPIQWSPVPLFNPDGSRNYANVSAYSALSRRVVNISDVYDVRDFNFEGTRNFDARTGFRSRSMLVVPMEDHEGSVIGVLQLINARDAEKKRVIDFSADAQQLTEALASQAAVAITNNRLIADLENLLESFIKTIAMAIDEKSPYTGGHIRRVAELTLEIAQAINAADQGAYKDVYFHADELKEIKMAAWLHDVGKIVTPEKVIDKATKLQTLVDRIELIAARFEIRKRDLEIAQLRSCLEDCGQEINVERLRAETGKLEAELQFVRAANLGIVPITQDNRRRLTELAATELMVENTPTPLISEDEIFNLLVTQGTLISAERDVIQNHAAMTMRMLSALPFPKKLAHVAAYAAAHHEKLNGRGYPLGIGGADLSLQARIIALADVFEALTAKDRPYKKAMSFAQAIKIMQDMAAKGEIDPELFEFLRQEGTLKKFAEEKTAS